MENIRKLEKAMETLGEEIVNCPHKCDGILNAKDRGIIPRGLILEGCESGEIGCMIIGLNPGQATNKEADYIQNNGSTYKAHIQYWRENISDIPYFEGPRSFIRQVGIKGGIVWSEVAKCQRAEGIARISLSSHPQTFGYCASLYLLREVQLVPEKCPIFACGRDAFTAFSYHFPRRIVIGFAHPTGFGGIQFRSMFQNGHLREVIAVQVKEILSAEMPKAHWITWEEG